MVADCANLDSNGVAFYNRLLCHRGVRCDLWIFAGMCLQEECPQNMSSKEHRAPYSAFPVHLRLLVVPALNILWNSSDFCFATAFKVILINSLTRSVLHTQSRNSPKKENKTQQVALLRKTAKLVDSKWGNDAINRVVKTSQAAWLRFGWQ